MFRSIGSALRIGSLAALVAIAPASAQEPVREGQRIVVPDGSPLRSELTIAVITAREIERILELPGLVEADPARTVKVLPPAAGRIVDIKVQIGDRVARQQELAVIYAAGSLRRSRFDPGGVRAHFAFAGAAASGGPTSQGRIDNLVAVAESDQAVVQLRAQGRPVGGNQDGRLLSLRAPVAGSVLDLKIAVGAAVRFSDAMMTIANLDVIWVTTSVPEQYEASIPTGQAALVRFPAYPRESFKGDAVPIRTAADSDALRRKIRIAFPNPERRFKPNMSASVTFGLKETVPMIPISALILNRTMAIVEVEPWVFETRAVGLGRVEGSQAIVASGLQVGERVVATGAARLLETR